MADPKLVEILKQGSEVWNRRRIAPQNNTQIDLSDSDLSKVNLREAYLSHANLYNANLNYSGLSHANLYNANLYNANLRGADLKYTDLKYANLRGANLIGADLSHADLSNANLSDANLSNANLRRTSLSETRLYGTTIAQVDLRTTKGLTTIKHEGPSRIELFSVQLPQDGSALRFLRGCGVPDEWIDFYRAQMMSPIEFYSCFISYSHQNEDFVKRLHADLQARGVRCWFAEEDLKIGDHYHQRIDEAIRLYDKLILVLSEAAVQSAWIEREVVAAREKEDRRQREVLFPLRLDDAVMDTGKAWAADVRRRWHIGDFTRWKDHDSYQVAFERLLRDLKAETKGEKNG